jgi:hypothetical protein
VRIRVKIAGNITSIYRMVEVKLLRTLFPGPKENCLPSNIRNLSISENILYTFVFSLFIEFFAKETKALFSVGCQQ